MILCIDAGNTNISFAVFENSEMKCFFDFHTEKKQTAFELFVKLKIILERFNVFFEQILEVKIASVVPELDRIFHQLVEEILQISKVKFLKTRDIPLKVNLINPAEVGIDRLINIFGALKCYGDDKNIIVIDFGTAITFDVGLKTFEYEGGVIFPGINLSLEALKNGTSKLPKVSLKEVKNPVGKSTSEAINSGIFFGYSGMVNGVVLQIKKQYNSEFKIILTGGFSSVLEKYFDFEFEIDNTLNLKGILKS
jgi:type III pantothenate kinase